MNDAAKRSVVMGVLRSTKGTSSRNKFAGRYTKHFWVVNISRGRLECYKNDQAAEPKALIEAAQIAGVSVSKDKHNKFFELCINLRQGKERRFRLNSRTERDRWLAALSDLIKHRSAHDRLDSIVSVIQRRMAECGESIGVEMNLDVTRISTLRDDLLESCVQAADVGVEVAKGIMLSLSSIYASNASASVDGTGAAAADGAQLRRIELTLIEARSASDSHTRFDPSSRTLIIGILLGKDPATGGVSFQHLEPATIMAMLTSNVWRDPSIEGWISSDEQAQRCCAQITSILDLKEPFMVTLQWGQMVTEIGTIAPYLARHVTAKLLEDIVKLLQNMQAHEQAGHSGSSGLAYLSRYVQGAAVRLDQDAIRDDKAPALQLLHSMFHDTQLNAAFVIVSKFRQLTVMPHGGSSNSSRSSIHDFHQQLRDVILYARVAEACASVQRDLSSVVNCRDGAVYNFESLVVMLASVRAHVVEEDLPLVILNIHAAYATRADRLVKALVSLGMFDNPFRFCTSQLTVNFESVRHDNAENSLPTLENGNFSDVVVGVNSEWTAAMSHVESALDGVVPRCVPGLEATHLSIFYSVEQLSTWLRGYFANPDNVHPAPEKQNEDESSSSGSDYDDFGFGDAVANERRVETRVLSVQDCVNIVYDSQGTELELKASSDIISDAIAELNATFRRNNYGDITKHDLIKIFAFSLQRMRELFSAESSKLYGAIAALPRTKARQVLHDYCEFDSSDKMIDEQVAGYLSARSSSSFDPLGDSSSDMRRGARQRVARSQSMSRSSPPSAPVDLTSTPSEHDYCDFQDLAHIALTKLLPNEALLSQRCRREVLVLGLENTGKSLVINSLRGSSHATIPSIGLNETVVAYDKWIFAMKEFGGRELFRRSWKQYFAHMRPIDAIVFVVDGARTADFADAGEYLRSVRKWKNFMDVPLLLILNNIRATAAASSESSVHAAARQTTSPSETERRVLDELGIEVKADAVFCVACDVTTPHATSSHRGIAPGVQAGMDWLCSQLLARCPPSAVPSALKAASHS